MTSAGKRKPLKAEVGTGVDERREWLGTAPVSLVAGRSGQRNRSLEVEAEPRERLRPAVRRRPCRSRAKAVPSEDQDRDEVRS
jgi:hypothetical protein